MQAAGGVDRRSPNTYAAVIQANRKEETDDEIYDDRLSHYGYPK